jgi:hypothetical protein
MSYPKPSQGETSGCPSEIECPTCGKANDITGDPEEEGDIHECVHCDAPFEVTGVDYRVTVTVKALPRSKSVCDACGSAFPSDIGTTADSLPGKVFCCILQALRGARPFRTGRSQGNVLVPDAWWRRRLAGRLSEA